MRYKRAVFQLQYPLAKKFINHLSFYKAVLAAYNKHSIFSEFWTYTIDAHLLQATIHWCMIFGSDKNNITHWKNLSIAGAGKLESNFRNGLLEALGLSFEEWDEYKMEIKKFRDKFAAHRDSVFVKPVPNFNLALQVVFFYDNWIREIIAPDILEEPL